MLLISVEIMKTIDEKEKCDAQMWWEPCDENMVKN